MIFSLCSLHVFAYLIMSYYIFFHLSSSCTFQANRNTPPSKPRKLSKSGNFKNVDKKLANLILDEIVDQGPPTSFSDIGKSAMFLLWGIFSHCYAHTLVYKKLKLS